ncbi:saccharopine dehydrogenase [Plectosphaerella plurivora]|uniref:Saccharopine dehydrogenase [NAD(+), L-lysine-forming] n=1 Tax=Plectosphaerella plurivora TaxID=936078 RepID=A0A9P8VK00_9PEZI|nr:saccharopine dehydrogenase [Plectosphaerella plurivora]
MSGITIHLRSETKPLEHRSALSPTTAKALVDAGYTLNVERSPVRIFDDAEFEKVGATLVEEGSWVNAPEDHIILGLKELLEEEFPLKHVHVTFHHCFKNQGGWEDILSRYARGGGTLLDLEFLEKEVAPGRFVRVAAFGWSAGFSGAALALQNWAWQLNNPGKLLPAVESYPNEAELLTAVKKSISEGQAKAGKLPRVLVIGALGRCGSGAVEMCRRAGIPEENITKWDIQETSQKPGPYQEIVESDIFINCIYLNKKIPPFIDIESLKSSNRQLSVVCDVSADTTNPNNPVPIYTVATTFDKPTVPVEGLGEDLPLSVISIDHLPSLLPREASETYGNDLVPHLLNLNNWRNDPVWSRAEKLFQEKVATLPEQYKKA